MLFRSCDLLPLATISQIWLIGLCLAGEGPRVQEFGESLEARDQLNDTWMYMPDGDGKAQIAYLIEPPNDSKENDQEVDQQQIENSVHQAIDFVFYGSDSISITRRQPLTITPQYGSNWSEVSNKYNPAYDTKILVHGWKSSIESNSITSIKGAYIERGRLNVFAINWRDQADNIYYLRPARYTIQVGRAVAKLIDLLVEELHADPLRIHLIGHSLGAHIMGYAGSYSRHRVGRITGLDPARPAFEECNGPENYLDLTDAEFVDVIHSCAGVLGFKAPIGHIDFYPNRGVPPQPGCAEITQIFTGCSHGRSYEYFAESISSTIGFYAVHCNNLDELQNERCNGEEILMGDPVPKSATKGIYYLKTASKPLYALGMSSSPNNHISN